MTISYNWLCDYLPVKPEPERLEKILTAIGLEVESVDKYESVKGGLAGLITGEVLTAEKHPNADKLTLTTVNTGAGQPLSIVCGAPNVAAGQKVIVAPVGATIYPTNGDPLTMKLMKIRGAESQGMICAEDEIGIGASHDGIFVLPPETTVGQPAATCFNLYSDIIFTIGLTPNRSDAMSHYGVARDVCAYLSHHDKTDARAQLPSVTAFKPAAGLHPISVTVENNAACPRYTGLSMTGLTVKESPDWMKNRLKAIGVRPISNIVDVSNYILHELGQPLHIFDADKIKGNQVIVKNLPQDTLFVTLDEKERRLQAGDLMICNSEEGMCIAGVFGGLHSGVSDATVNIFIEGASFNPASIRKTSVFHKLRTDAAARFEKGADISITAMAVKRAALLLKELAGGEVASEIIDVYPAPAEKLEIGLKYHYLKKLSGKNYHPDSMKKILTGLGFEIQKEGIDELRVLVPYSKTNISHPADIVEEIIRIDGYDNIDIPASVSMTPALDSGLAASRVKEKQADYLAATGFFEIFTNSIVNSAWYPEALLAQSVKMINSLSAELDMMRPSMLESGLVQLAYNINRRNNDLKFFEFGKTYGVNPQGKYEEADHLCIYATGNTHPDSWQKKGSSIDFYWLKGIVISLFDNMKIGGLSTEVITDDYRFGSGLKILVNNQPLGVLGEVSEKMRLAFEVKQPVFFADLDWTQLVQLATAQTITYSGIPRFPSVDRDLAMVVAGELPYHKVEQTIQNCGIARLRQMRLFDVFESDKLGAGKKSIAINLQFRDDEKTLTDKETDGMMQKIVTALQKELEAEIRK